MPKKNVYVFGLLVCLAFSSSNIFGAPPSEKVLATVYKLLETMRPLHVITMSGQDFPFSVHVLEGQFDLVGQASLKVLLGPCFSPEEWKSFYALFKQKFSYEHPNCSVEIHDHRCIHKSDLAKSACFLKSKGCLKQKYSEAIFDFKCLLPLNEVDLFDKKERIYS